MARLKTRRQQIVSEQRADLKKLIIIGFLTVVIAVFGIISIAGRGEDSAPRRAPSSRTEKQAPLPEGIESYPRVVSAEFPLSPSYVPDDLVTLYGVPNGSGIRMRQTAALSFEQMYEAMLEAGQTVIPLEGYVSYSDQSDLYESAKQEYISAGLGEGEAIAKALESVDAPGSCEHQTGLAIDISTDGTRSDAFLLTPQGRWIEENCFEYGFIIRYPDSKTDITGVGFEPWHLRYVGREHAVYMHENGLCLEEYVMLVQTNVEYAREEN